MDVQLKPLDGEGLPPLISVPKDGLTLGRDPRNGLVLDGKLYPHVSTYHAKLSYDGGRLVIEDLNSTNGISVNQRRVQRACVDTGDVIQLGGQAGPRFVVVAPSQLAATVVAKGPQVRSSHDLAKSSIIRIKSALGIPEGESDVSTLVRKRVRFTNISLVVIAILLTLGGWLLVDRLESGGKKLQEMERLNRHLGGRLEAQRKAWEEQKAKLSAERQALEEKVERLRRDGKASSDDLRLVRKRLQETTEKLEKYNPINLEKEKAARREKLKRTLSAVVFIEKKISYWEKQGKAVYIEESDDGVDVNLEERGEPFTREGGGSGFCISKEGWILTNAHVVEQPPDFGYDEWTLEARMEVSVVFSGTAKRHLARIVVRAEEEDDDLALLKIEPFEGIPTVENFEVKAVELVQGSEVHLFGFPLGKDLLQEEETLSASVFSGIVSRKVESLIQIHAAVYPGNSGGPVVDENGRVVGIVMAVQTISSGQIAPDIGYVIPIAKAHKVWPPPEPTPDKTEDSPGLETGEEEVKRNERATDLPNKQPTH